METRKLFLSFAITLRGLGGNKIQRVDLEHGLFYFGCAREHLLPPTDEYALFEAQVLFRGNPQLGLTCREQVVEAWQAAVVDGRADSIGRGEVNSFERLNHLLLRNGYPALSVPSGTEYNYIEIGKLVAAATSQLQVFLNLNSS